MDRGWSDKNKQMQTLLSKEATFSKGICTLLELRADVFEQVTQIWNSFPDEAFWQMPFPGANGYHSKTLSYSLWHIFRIEDIVAHEMIACDEQILFRNGFLERLHTPIITTGNELAGDDLVVFSRQIDRSELYAYAKAVLESTNQILNKLEYRDLRMKFGNDIRERLLRSKCVSEDENAIWLIDSWCGRDLRGIIRMPFSRHHIMHVEAMRRIRNRLCERARKGVDPIAYCGFSCNHCFLSQWCGSCRTNYNVCSFASCAPDGVCPNASCCREKGYDGCYECAEIEACQKGFYVPENDGANAAKAQALYIKRHGKEEFLKVHDRLHQAYSFSKTQEVLGQDLYAGLKILEES